MTPQFAEFEATVAEMIPEVSAVLTDPIASGQVTIKLRDRFAGFDVPLDRAGTGVAQLLHLVATVLFLPTGRMMLVDEPQLHLHPGAEKLLARFIRRHAEHDYLFSTHSSVFINALKPDRAWLLSRDEAGTHVRSIFDESLAKSAVLAELGLEAGDLVLAEKILLVEGPSDESIYPILLRRLGWDLVRQNCSVLHLSGADTARPLRELVEGLARLLNLRILLIVDGDRRDLVGHSRIVQALPVPDIESLFLRDPDAVGAGFAEALEDSHPPGFDLERWRQEWPTERIAKFISERREQQPDRKGASILADLAEAMGHLGYKKVVHGVRIADRLAVEAMSDLSALVRPLME
jgi:hypothetical protein